MVNTPRPDRIETDEADVEGHRVLRDVPDT